MTKYKVVFGTPVIYFKGEYHFLKTGEIFDAPEEIVDSYMKNFNERNFEKISDASEKSPRKKQKSEKEDVEETEEKAGDVEVSSENKKPKDEKKAVEK